MEEGRGRRERDEGRRWEEGGEEQRNGVRYSRRGLLCHCSFGKLLCAASTLLSIIQYINDETG